MFKIAVFLFLEVLILLPYQTLSQATASPPYYTSTLGSTSSYPWWYSSTSRPTYYSSTSDSSSKYPWWYSSTASPPYYTSTSGSTSSYPWWYSSTFSPPYYSTSDSSSGYPWWYSSTTRSPYYSSTSISSSKYPWWYSSTTWSPYYSSDSDTSTRYPWYSTSLSTSSSFTTESPFSTEKVCDCGKNSFNCKFDDNGNKICMCRPGYAQIAGICSDCNCGKNAVSCSFNAGEKKVCVCEKGYAQRKRECVETCRFDRDCFNGGICKLNVKGQSFCECKRDFSGDKCEANNICKRLNPICEQYGAVCKENNGIPSCVCPPQKVFRSGICEDICKRHKCIYGNCEIFGKRARCRCDEGYTGEHCDIKKSTSDPERNDVFMILSVLPLSFIIITVVILATILCRLKKKWRNEEKK